MVSSLPKKEEEGIQGKASDETSVPIKSKDLASNKNSGDLFQPNQEPTESSQTVEDMSFGEPYNEGFTDKVDYVGLMYESNESVSKCIPVKEERSFFEPIKWTTLKSQTNTTTMLKPKDTEIFNDSVISKPTDMGILFKEWDGSVVPGKSQELHILCKQRSDGILFRECEAAETRDSSDLSTVLHSTD